MYLSLLSRAPRGQNRPTDLKISQNRPDQSTENTLTPSISSTSRVTGTNAFTLSIFLGLYISSMRRFGPIDLTGSEPVIGLG
ncbi:MAG TPA: hypothetical protein DD416_07330 [Rhodobacteraceae bacterium]|jgi:hypothetical protein|nr:hypothetical protein [Paracoccaceae bacterium]